MLEERIDKLAAAVNRLCDAIASRVEKGIEGSETKGEPEKKPSIKKKAAAKKAKPETEKVEEESIEDAAAEAAEDIPSIEEVQAALGTIAQKYEPIMVIAGIKHYGSGRLSDLSDTDRAELHRTTLKLEAMLDADPALVDVHTPAELYKMALGE